MSGFENEGVMTFEPVEGDDEATHVTLQMTYTLPKLAAPLVENVLARRFMRYTVRRTMERFRDKMEEEAGLIVEVGEEAEEAENASVKP